MANVFIEESTMTAIGDAIRAKTGGTGGILPANMPAEIANITTGGGGGVTNTSGGLIFPADITASSANVFDQNTISGYIRVEIPEDGIPLGGWAYWYLKGTNSAGSSVGTIEEGQYLMAPGEELTVKSTSMGRTVYSLAEYTHTISGAYHMSCNVNNPIFYFLQPNAYIQNKILYAGEGTKGLFGSIGYNSTKCIEPYAIEGIDLRGSLVKRLPDYIFHRNSNIKKLWLSEVFEYFTGANFAGTDVGIEELHFTAQTPFAVGSSSVFSSLPTTCKIYVPAGTLSAYTSATYYPSASTYTYIEE
ncbi:MAG: hypothetical protein IKU72_02075 [Oscillospiraceae bacterium]|nr:hypothetical protein [Oscillospiraceae bacterium]